MNKAEDMNRSAAAMAKAERFGASNYRPLPLVIAKAEGVWVEDPEGRRYLDMLSAYSALNQGHRHPAILQALLKQAELVTLTSRAFHNEKLGEFCERLSAYTGKAKILPMNTGAEAVETAIKAARRWATDVKGIAEGLAEIIVCEGNFHGRTITATSLSTIQEYRRGFGPFTPGFRVVPYGHLCALEAAINPYTAAFLFEPIQGEAGVIVPPDGYLGQAAQLCREKNVLLIADEIQTGFGRTGRRFACDWENVEPDMYLLGKALGGGLLPISAVAADAAVLGVFDPGSHGSTFGGNPLACAVAIAAVEVVEQEQLAERADELGQRLVQSLKTIRSDAILDIRGKGLLIGIELNGPARPYCERLMLEGLLCKETHDRVLRLAPPLIIKEAELDWALSRLRAVLEEAAPH